MKIKVEKETKWKSNEVKTSYYVWIDTNCVAVHDNEVEAMETVNKLETSKEKIGSTIVYENEI